MRIQLWELMSSLRDDKEVEVIKEGKVILEGTVESFNHDLKGHNHDMVVDLYQSFSLKIIIE